MIEMRPLRGDGYLNAIRRQFIFGHINMTFM